VGESDDEDGSTGPPSRASACGGGSLQPTLPSPLNSQMVPMKIWSNCGDSESSAGFECVHDTSKRVVYAKFKASGEEPDEKLTKVAINTLLDLAEVSNSKKITIGLSPEHAGCATIVCSFLYLGFQVGPNRKSPLRNTAIMLDFHTGWIRNNAGFYSSEHDVTCTSDCSTSADEDLGVDFASD